MKSLSGALAVTALVALSVSSQGCAKIKELLKDPQADKPANVRPPQDYAYANTYCDRADQQSAATQATIKAIEISVKATLSAGATIESILAERKAAGDDRSRCQIIEDIAEYGADYARGKNVSGANAPMLTIDHLPSVDLNAVASLWLTSLNLSSVGADSLAPLTKMTGLRSLWLSAVPFSDLSPVGQLKSLEDLMLQNCAVVSDLGPITYLDRLSRLVLQDMKLSATRSGYRPLQALKNLQILDLTGSDVQSISMLPASKLGSLVLDQQYFGDAEFAQVAAQYPALTSLTFRSPNLHDISPASRMTALVQLVIPYGSYTNLDALSGAQSLVDLHVRKLDQNDEAALVHLPNLSSLSVEAPFTTVTDVSSLQLLHGLKSLKITYTGELQNLDAFTGLSALEALDLADFGGRIFSIAAIASMPKLAVLTLEYAQVQDISPIYGFLDGRKSAVVILSGAVLPRSQEQMNNTLRDKFGSRYLAENITIQR